MRRTSSDLKQIVIPNDHRSTQSIDNDDILFDNVVGTNDDGT